MGIFILYTRRKSKARRFFFKFSGNLQVGGISILLLREGGVPVGGGGRWSYKGPINHEIRIFSYLPPRPLGTPPPTGGGEWGYSTYHPAKLSFSYLLLYKLIMNIYLSLSITLKLKLYIVLVLKLFILIISSNGRPVV